MYRLDRIDKIKKIAESTVNSTVAPEVGQTVKLDSDPRYEGKNVNILSDPGFRDSPVVIVKDQYFDKDSFPGFSLTIHDELLRIIFIKNGWGPYYNYTGDVGLGYYLDNFLGQPAVILGKVGDYNAQANVAKAKIPNAAVYVIENNTDLNRIAGFKRLIKKY